MKQDKDPTRKPLLWMITPMLGTVSAWPLIKAIVSLLVGLIGLVGCAVILPIAIPVAFIVSLPARATHVAEERAFAAFSATVEAHPLPGNIRVLAQVDSVRWWSVSPDETTVAFLSEGKNQLGILDMGSRQVRFLDPLGPTGCPNGGSDRGDMRYFIEAWLDEHRLLIEQLPCGMNWGNYRLLDLDTHADFRLQWQRGSELTPDMLAGRNLFQVDDGYAIAVDQASGVAFSTRDDADQHQFEVVTSGQAVLPVATNWLSYSVNSGDWDDQIVNETHSEQYGPTGTNCDLYPFQWLAEDQGVIFFAKCTYYIGHDFGIHQRALLWLPVELSE